MPHINVVCKGYEGDYEYLNGDRIVEVPIWKFLAASITIGFQRFGEVVESGPRLWMHRFGLGLAGISFLADENGALRLAESHKILDGSEKGAISYWQGMVLAKIVAAEVLDVRWLQHADAMERSGHLKRVPTADTGRKKKSERVKKKRGKRADMVGHDDSDRWHVIEAKGFSSHPGDKAFSEAKKQASMVESINNRAPDTTSASVSCLWKRPIEVVLDDPPIFGKERLAIPEEDFWQSYYGPLAKFIRESDVSTSREELPGFVFAPIPRVRHDDLNMFWPYLSLKTIPHIGLPESLLEDPTSAPKVIPELFRERDPYRTAKDGIALIGDLGSFSKHSEEI